MCGAFKNEQLYGEKTFYRSISGAEDDYSKIVKHLTGYIMEV